MKQKSVSQHEKWRWVFTCVSWIDSVSNCLISIVALLGLASSGVKKIIGNGFYLKKGGRVCQIETDWKWLYLSPAGGDGLETVGNDLYLMKEGRLYDGTGLLLSPNSPFKNNPILGMIL